jgi:hypothetical protein
MWEERWFLGFQRLDLLMSKLQERNNGSEELPRFEKGNPIDGGVHLCLNDPIMV